MDHAFASGRRVATALLLASAVLAAPVLAEPASPRLHQTRAAPYETACAACHGRDGRGADRSTVGFDVPLPDFTDCRAWPREADDDWFAITHDGGPARAFDPLMPAYGRALSREEIEAALSHVREFCRDDTWPRGELNLPRPLVTEKAFPEDEVVTTTDIATEGPGEVVTKAIWEQRIGSRTQWEAIIPIPAHSAQGDWTGGVGDLVVAMKRVLHHQAHERMLSLITELKFPTGSEERGTGDGTVLVEPALAYGMLLPAEGFIQLHGGVGLSGNRTKAGNEAFWRATAGRTFAQGLHGRAWSPMLEVLGARELGSGHATEWDLVPQVQVTLSTRQHIRLNAGFRVPLTDAGPRPTRFVTYFLWDWFDGGLLEGW